MSRRAVRQEWIARRLLLYAAAGAAGSHRLGLGAVTVGEALREELKRRDVDLRIAVGEHPPGSITIREEPADHSIIISTALGDALLAWLKAQPIDISAEAFLERADALAAES